MTNEQALEIIRDTNSDFNKCVEASGVLAESDSTPLEHLLECLKRRGLCAEIAAMKLYKRTKRPSPTSPNEFILDWENWSNYLSRLK